MIRSKATKKIIVVPKAEVEVMKPTGNTHLISISDGPGDQARIKNSDWRSVSFHYFLDAGYTEDLVRACGPDFNSVYRSYFRPQEAERLRDRIEWVAKRAGVIVVNCYSGRGRCAAVARYINETYGFELDKDPGDANQTVYRLLKKDPDLLASYDEATASPSTPTTGGLWEWCKGLMSPPGDQGDRRK